MSGRSAPLEPRSRWILVVRSALMYMSDVTLKDREITNDDAKLPTSRKMQSSQTATVKSGLKCINCFDSTVDDSKDKYVYFYQLFVQLKAIGYYRFSLSNYHIPSMNWKRLRLSYSSSLHQLICSTVYLCTVRQRASSASGVAPDRIDGRVPLRTSYRPESKILSITITIL